MPRALQSKPPPGSNPSPAAKPGPTPKPLLTSELIRAARALLRWDQRHLANASAVSLPTIKRLEAKPGIMAGAHTLTLVALQKALEEAGVEFIAENGGGAGVRLRKQTKRQEAK